MKRVNLLYLIFSIMSISLLSSCLKRGLDANSLPRFSDALMTNVFMEYRFEDPTATSGGSPVVRIVNLTLSGKQFKKKEDTPGAVSDSAIFNVTVPAASGSFTTTERAKVTQSNIVFMCNISTASIMEPIEGSPKAGVPGDFSQPRKYKITAADGSSRIWTVRIANFTK